MSEAHSSYRQIIKATSIFGGVQIFNILIAIIRSKFIAILLGPAGMGISGLLISAAGLIGSITNLGLGISAVKNISAANSSEDINRISKVVAVVGRLVWITGLLGALLTFLLSGWLSEMTFGNRSYSVAFSWISITLLLNQLSSGQLALLQGLRKLQYLAKASLAGSLIGLFISIPIYYVLGIEGIVPAIIINSIFTFFFSWYFASKVKLKKVHLEVSTFRNEGWEMIRMGFLLSLSGLVTLGTTFILRVYLSRNGGVDQVGYYDACFTIINTYVGLIFTAMSTDYYPRLSEVADNNTKLINITNQQAEISLLILAPILTIFLIFNNLIVELLYSQRFIVVKEMMQWASLGMYFKAASWTVAFILLAKGAAKIFLWNELLSNFNILFFNLAGYLLWGLEGLGIAFFIGYIFYLIQVFLLTKLKYSFKFEKEFLIIFGLQLSLGIACFGVAKFVIEPFSFLIGAILIVISFVYSYIEMNKRLDMNEIYKKIFK